MSSSYLKMNVHKTELIIVLSSKLLISRVCGHISVIPELRRPRQEDIEFQANLEYIVKLCLKKNFFWEKKIANPWAMFPKPASTQFVQAKNLNVILQFSLPKPPTNN
jgi:hypothetical protein